MAPNEGGVRVSLEKVGKHFGPRTVFQPTDLSISPGEFVAVVGASGGGKSTLLRLIAGLEPASSGKVEVTPVPRTAFVFQESQLLPWRTVAQNVCLPLELLGVPRAARAARVAQALERVGMQAESALVPSQLSGGMKMRVSLARALVIEPTLLLLDEPLGALDELTRVRLEEQLRAVWEASRMTTVFVTHSFSEAVFLSDRVVILAPESVGEVVSIPLGPRNAQTRTTVEFARLVQQCRSRFEAQCGERQ